MVASGVTRARLPGGQRGRLHALGPGRRPASPPSSARRAARRPWSSGGPQLAGAVVVVGNAPTALFRLLEMVEAGADRPAAVIGVPVGFVGAAESKAALARQRRRRSSTWSCTAGAAAARSPPPPSTRSRATSSDGRDGAGRLYGIGVGPGDPELLTVKAQRLIAAVDVVAYPDRAPRPQHRARHRRAAPARRVRSSSP